MERQAGVGKPPPRSARTLGPGQREAAAASAAAKRGPPVATPLLIVLVVPHACQRAA